MSRLPLNCIPDVDAFSKTLSANGRKLALIFVSMPLPLLALWLYELYTGNLGYVQIFGWAFVISFSAFALYSSCLYFDPFHAGFLNAERMARFHELVETWSGDQHVIQFVRGIHSQDRKPINIELTRLANYAAFAEQCAKLEKDRTKIENDWQEAVAAVDPDLKEFAHE